MRLIQSIARAVRILEVISECNEGYKLKDISERMGLQNTTVHNILSTLCQLGLAKQTGTGYCLGPKTLQLGSRYLDSLSLYESAYPLVKDLVTTFNESFFIVSLNGHEFTFLIKIDCTHNVKTTRVGADKSASHATAVGKVLLSSFSGSELDEFIKENILFEPFTKNTITTREELIRELDEIREVGYALDREETEAGLYCVAAPIYDHHRHIIASLGVSMPIQRFSADLLEQIRNKMLEYAGQISSDLGYVKA